MISYFWIFSFLFKQKFILFFGVQPFLRLGTKAAFLQIPKCVRLSAKKKQNMKADENDGNRIGRFPPKKDTEAYERYPTSSAVWETALWLCVEPAEHVAGLVNH